MSPGIPTSPPRTPTPRLTIGMPVYNGERYLGDAIESILAQSFGDFTLLIADNASTDGTEDLCRRYAAHDNRIRYVRHPANLGASANFNFVFRGCGTEYFKWAAHDDVLGADFLRLCMDGLDSSPTAPYAMTLIVWIDEEGRVIEPDDDTLPPGLAPADRLRRCLLTSILGEIYGVMRTGVLRRVRPLGGYLTADRVQLADIVLRGDRVLIPEFQFFERRHPAAYTYRLSHSMTRAEAGAFWNPRSALPVGLQRLLRIRGFLGTIARAPIPVLDKVRCGGALAGWSLSVALHRRQPDTPELNPGKPAPRPPVVPGPPKFAARFGPGAPA
jgi:glycosyltransferase involved in cell wall biosynthesis